MTAPLLTRDARELRLLMRPRWQLRLMAWTLPIAAGVLIVVHTWSVGPIVCTVQDPCEPDTLSSVYIGLVVSAAISGFIYPRLAAWFGTGFVVGLVVSERLMRPELISPPWLYIVDLGFVGLCALLGGVSRDRRPTDGAARWLAGVRRERPPTAADLPHAGRGWRLVGWFLLVLAVACLVWGFYVQAEVDAQQRAATTATADVIAHPDEFTIAVRLAGQTATISVLDSRNYPVGGRIELYVDDRGLRQPVSEPYDATGWIFLGVLSASVAWLCWARGAEKRNGPRRLFNEKQPIAEVSVLPGIGVVAVYAGDARPGEPAIFVIRTRPVVMREDDGEVRVIGPDLEPRMQPASLYGVPAPGHWCAVVVGGEPVVPMGPISAKQVTAPPYGVDAFDTITAEDVDSDGTTADASKAPRLSDLPLRAEEVEALRPVDRDATSDQVRVHVRSAMVGYAGAAAIPLALIPAARLLPDLRYEGLLLVAGVIVAASCGITWRLFMRGRIAWNGKGISVVGVIRDKRVPWRMVSGIEHGHMWVTVHTGYHSLVVGAGPLLGIFGRRDRTAEELANALRHARNAARAGGHENDTPWQAGMDGPMVPTALDDLPRVDPLPAPVGMYILWLVWTPVFAWLLQVFATT